MKIQNLQLLVSALAVTFCTSQDVKREQRKFIYQEGYPSVRRYPVYPDRISDNLLTSSNKEDVSSSFSNKDTKIEPVAENVEVSTDNFLLREPEATTTTTTTTTLTPIQLFTSSPPLIFTTAEAPREGVFGEAPRESIFSEAPRENFFSDAPREGFFSEAPREGVFSEAPREGVFNEAPRENFFSEAPSEGFFTPKDSSIIRDEPSLIGNTNDEFDPSFVFPSADELPRPLSPSVAVPLPSSSSSSFGVFNLGPEESSTDMALTTDMPNEMSEDNQFDQPTVVPELEGLDENLVEGTTDSPISDMPGTESPWDSVTEEIYTTEATDIL